ncbi:MAG: M23 family metallopeptidase [Ignavibacteriales bacterium]|nr:M23 family metallopeptidase [Ignavibacteriales bacterium]
MNKYTTVFFLFVFISTSVIHSQKIQLNGDIQPASLIVGKCEQVDYIRFEQKIIRPDKEGNFILAFQKDSDGTRYIPFKLSNGKVKIVKIDLPARKYEQEKLILKTKYVSAPEKENERIKSERKLMRDAKDIIAKTDTAYFLSGFTIPIKGGRISSQFGTERIVNDVKKSTHWGLDIAIKKGTPVYAMSDGIVRLTGKNFYYSGNCIYIDHGLGLYSTYLHLSEILVKENQLVKKGQIIGKVGSTGRSTGPHLHWGVAWLDISIDPLSVLKINDSFILNSIGMKNLPE